MAGRWDTYYGSSAVNSVVGDILGMKICHDIQPEWVINGGVSKVRFAPTQATFDREIQDAADNSISSFSYLEYGQETGEAHLAPDLMGGWVLHQSSSVKNLVNWNMMTQLGLLGSTGSYEARCDKLVAWMLQSNYLKVDTNRPVLEILWDASAFATYWGSSYVNLKAAVDYLRSAALAESLGNPYVIITGGATLAHYNGVAADAIGHYNGRNPGTARATYADLAASTEAYWTTMAALAVPIVPTVTLGWWRQARAVRVPPWESSIRPYVGRDIYCAKPTTEEWGDHVQACIDFIDNNPSSCPYRLMRIYAWNEYDEAGLGLSRTRGVDGANPYLEAIGGVL